MPIWSPHSLPDAPPPKGPYSPAIRAGNFIYVSGQVPRDPRTGDLIGADIIGQTRQTLDNVEALIKAAGGTLADVISCIVYLQNVDDWEAMNSVYKEYFSQPYPTRTAVGADLRDILVEISVVAYIG